MKKSNTGILLSILAVLVIFVYIAPFFSFNLGKNAYERKDYVKAFSKLHFAYHMHKSNEDYRYYYVLTLTKLKPALQVQKDIFEISQSKIEDSAKRIAASKVAEWRSNINYNTGNNYIYNAPSENGIVRWNTDKMPLKVGLKHFDNVPGYYRNEVVAAFNQWQNSVDFLKFEYVQKNSKADIIIEIAPMPKNVCKEGACQYIVGYTVPKIKNNILKKMTITLYDKTPDGKYFSEKVLFNTIMHELGHALGIMGHSYYEGDLMFVSTTSNNKFDYTRARSSFQYLTSGDINTLKLLYKLIPDVSNTPVEEIDTTGLIYAPIIIGTTEEMHERKIEEALAYIQQAPEMSGGYVDLAIAYAELGKNEKAIQSFKKAIKYSKTDSELYLAYYNLAVLYSSMNNKSNALKYAKKAKALKDTDEVIELISRIKG